MSETSEKQITHVKVIDFMAYRKVATMLSALLLIVSIASLSINGLKFGLDFTGGTQLELAFESPANLNQLREQLASAGFEDAVVVYFGEETDVMVRLQQEATADLGDKVMEALRADGAKITLKQLEFVGPQVGEELRDDGGLGMLFALAVVMAYVAFRFQFKFSVGAVVALAHDVIIVLGFFSLLQLDFDLTVLAAVLAVIGYSLNDTIVVSDRIRENFRRVRESSSAEVINISLSETLGRTFVTSLTTLLVLIALFLVGGEIIHGFSIALIVGVVVGTYSSVYVAANVLMMMNINRQDLMEPIKEGEEFDELP
ncbi:protein translocase subunit SecF [Marinibactrum halimedae]|uniref:Protein-export membrane protein SecF n=1 Tax=Marinibactrum halimedae TaxID=1444977 RepID=A0AA37T917_9GAMM|nr:protein translocase subunit SecF [Marinibactrum halimedae]MCD9458443.1 protein translocase subunit SecF [Marinibactrum halimedae]GLS26141.1 protein-export membrane protein SecF [Marinibactrum halimedae]